MIHNYFSDLELTPAATLKDVKQAYRRLAKKYHPDVYEHPEAKEIFQKIYKAFEYLSSDKHLETLKQKLTQKLGKKSLKAASYHKWLTKKTRCLKCQGRGFLKIRRGSNLWDKTCPKCLGQGG